MNQQESSQEMLEGVNKLGDGAMEMIQSLDKLVKKNFANMGEAEAIKFAETLKATKLDSKIAEFRKEINNLSKTFK